MVYPIRSTLINSKYPRKFYPFYRNSSFFVYFVYSIFGILNFVKLGNQTQEIIFYNYMNKYEYLIPLFASYIISLLLSGTYCVFPVFNFAYKLRCIKQQKNNKVVYFMKLIARISVIIICYLIAYMFDNIMSFI